MLGESSHPDAMTEYFTIVATSLRLHRGATVFVQRFCGSAVKGWMMTLLRGG